MAIIPDPEPRSSSSSPGLLLLLFLFSCSMLIFGPVSETKASDESGAPAVVNNWYLRSRTTGYAFTTAPPEGQPEQNHFEFYQHLDGAVTGMAEGKLDLRFSMRFADDMGMRANPTTPSRLHVLYLQYRTPMHGRARLGRQFVQQGTASYTMDGLYLTLKPTRRLWLSGWGGARTPYSLEWGNDSIGDQGTLGARATLLAARWLKLGLGWTYLERHNLTQYQKVGTEAVLRPCPQLRTTLRGHYEFATEKWDKAEVLAWYRPTAQWPTLSFQYLDRRQTVDKNTYWERFLPSLDRVRVARASARYETTAQWGLEAEYFGSFVDEFAQTRLGGAILFPYGRLGYSARLGDAGEESRWYGDLRYRPVSWCSLSGGAMLSTYALLKDAPDDFDRDLVTLYARAITRLRNGLDLHVEFQSLDNPEYSKDLRLLVGVDLAMGRGASALGLGTGGWLQ